jgi:RNA polymerase sigma-70 factor (sigma-E family)
MRSDDSFDEYARARWPILFRSAIMLGCNQQEAEDMAQTALASCLVAWDRVQRSRDADAYVHQILINTFRRSRRRSWHREIPTELVHAGSATDPTNAAEVSLVVRQVLAAMPIKLRSVLVLRHYADLSEAHTARILDIPLGTVKSRLARAQQMLREDPSIQAIVSETRND